MSSFQGFLKTNRSSILFELFLKEHNTFRLLFFIAYTLNRESIPNMYGCQQGESRVSYHGCKLTDSEFRTARKRLEELGLAKFVTRGKGRGQKTYGQLTNTSMFDPNIPTLLENNLPNINAIETAYKILTNSSISDSYDENTLVPKLNNNTISSFNPHDGELKTNKEQENKKEDMKKRTTATCAVALYDCLLQMDNLSLEEKKSLMQYPEDRVQKGIDWAKANSIKTTLIRTLHWHCRLATPPEPTAGNSEQQRIALLFNEVLKEHGHHHLYDQNLTAIPEGKCYILVGVGATTISLSNEVGLVKKDLEESKLEILKSHSNKVDF